MNGRLLECGLENRTNRVPAGPPALADGSRTVRVAEPESSDVSSTLVGVKNTITGLTVGRAYTFTA
jgi:hypothetical protein